MFEKNTQNEIVFFYEKLVIFAQGIEEPRCPAREGSVCPATGTLIVSGKATG